jgi:hypothetical protein
VFPVVLAAFHSIVLGIDNTKLSKLVYAAALADCDSLFGQRLRGNAVHDSEAFVAATNVVIIQHENHSLQ